MGYKKINNLYKDQTILSFKECYAMEKVHGSSQNISYNLENDKINYFSGGANHLLMVYILNNDKLLEEFRLIGKDIVIYGEGYGGKCQGMSASYGKKQQFVAFEVKINNIWLSVIDAEDFCTKIGIEFMPYERIECTLEAINKERDRDSIIGKRRTGKDGIIREGVVLRPINEWLHQGENGGVIRVKHKRDEFMETRTKRKVGLSKEDLEILTKANEIADEWVTSMRVEHVIDKLPRITDMRGTPEFIKAMLEDVLLESKDEIVDSKEARKAICNKAAKMLKRHFVDKLNGVR